MVDSRPINSNLSPARAETWPLGVGEGVLVGVHPNIAKADPMKIHCRIAFGRFLERFPNRLLVVRFLAHPV